MIAVSDAWKDIQQRFLLPEGFVEITCAITEAGAQESATASGTNEAVFSDVSKILDTADVSTATKYATNELNLWALDGSCAILPDTGPYNGAGYVSDIEATGSVTLTLPEIHTVAIPGVTIAWGEEYPPVFTVTAKNGGTVVAELTVTDNAEKTCVVDLELNNYDSVTITVHNWCLPHRRPRIEKVSLGHTLVLTKKDIISYTHEQHGDLLSGELPKYSIEFTLDNIDGRWNPNNPTGMGKYLAERQKLTVRYGLDVNGTTEWIKAGTFYLSEWRTPANGLEARFVARDIFEFLISADMNAAHLAPLDGIVDWATRVLLPSGTNVVIDNSLANYSKSYIGDSTAAEIVQKCANAAGCVLRYDRDGVLNIEPLNKAFTDYRIPLSLSYSHPEIELSKPLKAIAVDYGADAPYELSVSSTGETQTIHNDFVTTEDQAFLIADWVNSTLKMRKTVSGEFRADPRLDLFDIVTVESKYGALSPVAITSIKYTFNGSFRGSFTGKVLDISEAVLGTFVLGRDTLG